MKHYIELNQEQKTLENYVNQAIHVAVASHFPKKCNTCERVYGDEKDYTHHTHRCGNTMHEKEDFLSFFRNCNCGSTLMIPIYYEDVSKTELSAILDHGKNLARIAVIQSLEKLEKNESIRTNGFWKYMKNLHQFRGQEDDAVQIHKITSDEWLEVGLSILRDRYNMWLRGENHRL